MARRRGSGLGPVFAHEWLSRSRRWQGYALRSLLVLLLVLGLSAAWVANRPAAGPPSARQKAEIGQAFYAATGLILLGLVGLAAPAATAGAVCLDKARGTLDLLFATDLTDAEIVLGKLAARLVPVCGLVAGAVPVLVAATLLGGIDPAALVGAMLVCLACAVFGAALALTVSVWGRKTHEVLLATYAFGVLYLLSAPGWAVLVRVLPWEARPDWLPGPWALLPYNPVFLTLAPLGAPAGLLPAGLWGQVRFCVLGFSAAAVLAATATWRIRAVALRQVEWERRPLRGGGRFFLGWASTRRSAAGRRTDACPAESTARRTRSDCAPREATRRGGVRRKALGWLARLLQSPSLDADPVLWRERHRRRPTRRAAVGWSLLVVLSGGFTAWTIVAACHGMGPAERELAAVANGVQAAAGLLLVGVSAATCLAEERRRGSLDALLATPLTTRSIVLGKWRGAFGIVPWLAAPPVLVAAALATHAGATPMPVLVGVFLLAYGAALTSLGLALAVWLPRMDRAVGLAAGCHVVVTVAAIAVGMSVLGDGPGEFGPGFASASPFWGVGFSSALCGDVAGSGHGTGTQAGWLVLWTAVYGLAASGLLLATLTTFDRCLGRMKARVPAGRISAPAAPTPATGACGSEDGS